MDIKLKIRKKDFVKKLSKLQELFFVHIGFKRYLASAGWLFAGKIGGMIISFFVVAYVARYLGPQQYGTLSYIISLVGIFSFLANLGIDSVLYRDLVNYPEKEAELLGTAFVLKIFGSMLAIAAVLVVLIFLQGDWLVNFFTVLASLSFLFQSFNVIVFYFQSKSFSKKVVISSSLVIVVLSLVKVLFVYLNCGLGYFVGLLVVEQLLYALILVYIYNQLGGVILSWKFNHDLAKKILHQSWPLLFSSAFVLIYNRIDQVMIMQMLDISSVGLYDIAVRLSEFWYFIPGLIVTAVFPAVVNAKKVSFVLYRSRFLKLFGVILTLSILASFVVFFLSGLVVSTLFGPQYMGAVTVLNVYVWAGIGMSIGVLTNQYLIIEGITKISFLANFIGMLLNIGLNFYLIPKFGIIGAAYATLVSYFTVPFFIIIYISRERKEIYV